MAASAFSTIARGGKRRRTLADEQQVLPEEERSLVRSAGETALGGLAMAGNLLDVPGSMVRDTLAGQNLFDQLLPWNWFSAEGRTSGRDLNRQQGLSRKKDNWGNFAGGLATEILTDPLTYATFGASALGKGGQVAKAAGLIDDAAKVVAKKAGVQLGKIGPRQARLSTSLRDLVDAGGVTARQAAETAAAKRGVALTDDVLDAPLGGMFGIGMPFRQPAAVFGNADGLLGKAGQFLDKYSLNPISPGRAILDAKVPGTDFAPVGEAYRLMDSTIREATTPLGRELARGLGRAQEAGRANARLATAEYANRLADLGDVDPGYLRQVVELPDVRSGATPELQSLAGDMRSQIDPMVADAKRLGLPLESLDDPAAEYFPRYLSDQIRPARGAGSAAGAGNGPRAFSTFDSSSTGRKEFLKGVEGGTQTIKEIAQDADVGDAITAGMKPKDLADAIEAKYPGAIPEANRKAFAKWLSKLSPETRAAGVFGNDVLPDLQARMTSHNLSRAGAEAVYEGLSQPGIVRSRTGADDAGVSVLQILSGKTGFAAKESRRILAEILGVDPAALRNMVVDKDIAEDLLRFMQKFDGPQPAKGWLKFVDSLTNFTKGALTSVWPSFHVRNLTSGQFGNWLNGLFSAESFNDARKMMRGGSIKAAAIPAVQQIAKERGITNLTDAAASQIVGELSYAHGVIGKFQGVGSSVAGTVPTGSTTQDILDELVAPGREQINYARTARRAVGMEPGATLNPLRAEFRGVGQGTESTWGPMAAGQDVGNFVEGLNRLAPFIKQLRDGVSPAEAAKRIGQVQVDYNSRFYTNFERQVLSRAFPFYKFSARTAPEVARNLMETPGGMLGATIRTANNLRDPNEVTPDYIANSTSIPLGTLEDGSDRYLTGFGMQFEDPLSFLGGGFRGAGMEALSRLNPVAKGPLEWITGESFFQQGPMGGRDLEDLDGNIGRIGSNLFGTNPKALPVWAEHALANSPVSRALTTARTLTDPRKGLLAKAGNTLTGMRVSDVSPAAQDALLRERANAAMRGMGARNFARLYVPDADLQAMSPAQREKVQRFQKLLKSLEKRAKKRKQDAAAADQKRG